MCREARMDNIREWPVVDDIDLCFRNDGLLEALNFL